MQRIVIASALVVVGTIGAVEDAEAASVLYREVFPRKEGVGPQPGNGDGNTNTDQFLLEGWRGGNTGDKEDTVGVGDNDGGEGAIGAGAPFAPERKPVNSNPRGPLKPQTFYGFTSQQGIGNLFSYTTEFHFDSAHLKNPLTRISWDSRNDNALNLSPGGDWSEQGAEEGANQHVVVRIGGRWFATLEGVLHGGDGQTWLPNTVAPAAQQWAAFDERDDGKLPGITLQDGVPATIVAAGYLPKGKVDAFGLYTARPSGNIRFDNFTVSKVPAPAALPMLLGALGGLGALSRRRRRAA